MLKFIKRLAKLILELVKELFLKNNVNDLSTIHIHSNSTWLSEIYINKNEEYKYVQFQESLRIIGSCSDLLQHKEKEISDFDIGINSELNGIVNGDENHEREHRTPTINYFYSVEDDIYNKAILREPSLDDNHFRENKIISLENRQKEIFSWGIPK